MKFDLNITEASFCAMQRSFFVIHNLLKIIIKATIFG